MNTVLLGNEQCVSLRTILACALLRSVVGQLAAGVVCSAQEAKMLKQELGVDFKLVTPGIRPASTEAGDQRRILTPAEAIAAGSDYLVIGRPITQAADPLEALVRIEQEIAGA